MNSDPPDPAVVAARERAQQRAARYDEDLRQIARETGARLAGDDGTRVVDSVKGLGSLARKVDIQRSNVATLDEALARIDDLNRYTLIYGNESYTPGVERARELLEERGFAWERGKNTWDDPVYKGHNTWFRDQSQPHAGIDPEQAGPASDRNPLEVQFHTLDSFAAKSDNHDRYELVRSGELDRKEEAAANELQARRNEGVTAPPGYERLPDRIPPRERPNRVSERELETVREKAAALRDERTAGHLEPARAPPVPPAAELRGLVPGQRGGGRRIDDQAIDREGLELT